MYDRIIVPLDGSKRSEAVLPYARLLAKAFQAKISLLQAVEFDESSLPPDLLESMIKTKAAESKRKSRRDAEEYLSSIETTLAPVEVEKIITNDKPGEAIAAAAADRGEGALIAMSTHGRSGIGRWVVGSVTDKVIHDSANSMFIFRPVVTEDNIEQELWKRGSGFSIRIVRPDVAGYDSGGEASLERVVLPLDGSTFSEHALSSATALAKKLSLDMSLVRIPTSTMQMSMVGEWPSGYPNVMSALEEASKEYLDAKAEELRDQGVANVESRIPTGEAANQIVEVAQERDHSVIVMTSRGRSGIGRAILGSVADRVVSSSPAPVLLVRA